MKISKLRLAESALLSNTIIWGGTFVLIKSALTDASPTLFVAVRFAIASVVLLPFMYKSMLNVNKKQIFQGFILGLLLFFGFILQTVGLTTTSATKSAFITGSFVLFTPILEIIIERRKPTKINILSILLVVTGLTFLSSKGETIFDVFKEIGSDFSFGDTLTLICAFIFALYIVYLDKISQENDHKFLTFAQIFTTFVLASLSSVFFSSTGVEEMTFRLTENLVFVLLYTSLLATVLNLFLTTKYQPVVTPTKAGLIFSMEPIFAAVFAYFILSEVPTAFVVTGALFIFSGVIISEVFKSGIKETSKV